MAVDKKYKANIIKAIFPDEYVNSSNVSDDLVERYYKTDNLYLDAFQIPDMLTNINSYHGFSKNISKVGEDTLHYYTSNNINKISYISPTIDPSDIDIDEINNSYHKIIMGKDLDWENAYLRYVPSSFNTQENPITYWDIDPNTGLEVNKGVCTSYLYYSNIPTYINHTYDLYAIVDYLLTKVKALKFALSYIKSQHENMKTYQLHQSNS